MSQVVTQILLFGRWLTDPNASVTDPERRLKAHWVMLLAVALYPLGILTAAVPFFIGLINGMWWVDIDLVVVILFGGCMAFGYWQSRQGHYEIAALLLTVTSSITIYLAVLSVDKTPDNPLGDAAYLVMPILFSSIMLSPRFTTLLAVGDLIALALLPALNPNIRPIDVVVGPVSVIAIGAALGLFGNFLSHTLERLHTNALTEEINERTRAEQELRRLLDEKEVLLKEVHHRVKNNLQIISSLLNLQSGMIQDPATQMLFQDSQNRIRAMTLIHERLYRSHDLTRINLAPYIQELTTSLSRTYQQKSINVRMHIHANDIEIDMDTAVSCGLIINELVSNALKHAFTSRSEGEIIITLQSIDPCHYRMLVQDNGVGLPSTVNIATSETLGLQLVNSLVKQLDGTINIQSQQGTRFEIDFTDQGPGCIGKQR